MTPQEAEQLVELWAQRQQQVETARAMPSINDLADVLNAPPDELAALLAQVRGAKPVVKPKNNLLWLRRLGISAGILMLLGAAATAGFIAGEEANRSYPVAAYPYSSPVNTNATPPGEYVVTFDGYAIPGSGPVPSELSQLSEKLEMAMMRAANEMGPNELTQYAQPTVSTEVFLRRLSTDQVLDGWLVFRDASIKGPNGEVKAKMPTLLANSPEWIQLVREEQARRIKRLVSQIVTQTK